MNASTTREPFTTPLTYVERQYIRERRSEIMRDRTRPRSGPQLPITQEQMEKEIDEAIAFSQRGRLRRGSFPPVCHVPSVALSAVVGP